MMDRCFDVVLSFNSRPNKYSLTNKTPCCHFYGAAVLKVDYRLIVVLVRRVLSLIVSVLPNEAALHQYQIAICIRSSLVRCVRVWRQSCNCSGRRPWRDPNMRAATTRCLSRAVVVWRLDGSVERQKRAIFTASCVGARASKRYAYVLKCYDDTCMLYVSCGCTFMAYGGSRLLNVLVTTDGSHAFSELCNWTEFS